MVFMIFTQLSLSHSLAVLGPLTRPAEEIKKNELDGSLLSKGWAALSVRAEAALVREEIEEPCCYRRRFVRAA